MCGEFDGITHQVGEYLAEAQGIAHQTVGYIWLGADCQFDTTRACLEVEQVGNAMQYLTQIEGDGLNLQSVGLDLRKVEDVVDHAE